MDTWLKKLIENKWVKGISIIGAFITTFAVILMMLAMKTIPNEESYFDSSQFKELFVKKAGYVRDWIVRYNNNEIFSMVTQTQVDAYIAGSGRPITQEEAIEAILANRSAYYSTIQNELLVTNKNLEYFAMDVTTGEYITNMPGDNTDELIKEITSRDNYLIGNGYYILNLKYGTGPQASYYSGQYMKDMNYYAGDVYEGQENYRIYVALKEELVQGDDFYFGYQYMINCENEKRILNNVCLNALILDLIFMTAYMLTIDLKKKEGETFQFTGLEKLPLELQGLIMIINFVFLFNLRIFERISPFPSMSLTTYGIQFNALGVILLFLVCLIPISIIFKVFISVVKHVRQHNIWQFSGLYRLANDIMSMRGNKTSTFLVVGLITLINIMVDCILFLMIQQYIYEYGVLVILPIVLWNVITAIGLIKLIADYRKILQAAKAITEGELDRKVVLGASIPIFCDMAETVNSMGTGLEKAVNESLKSERLKTELITNVSHDLKTPLTSIISYIDLLKDEVIENEVVKEYIGILDERSHRLKQLVEDLVEASKAVTGNLKADITEIRLNELVGQAVGEYLDRIEANNLIVAMNQMQEVSVMADGRHMWRIIENLLSNVCKYAMPHTRVYISVYSEGAYGYCTIKNISKEPLNIDPKELTERFVRGDEARTTEGSGLGLAIAKSLVLLQQGLIEIVIDGDLFKVTVKVPLKPSKETVNLDKK